MAQTIIPPQATTPPRPLERLLRAVFHYLRVVLACIFVVIGILGVILPVLPGTIWLIIATLIIGRESRLLRQGSVAGKRWLRRLAAHKNPVVGWVGSWSVAAQRDTSRSLRRVNWWLARMQASILRRVRRA
jgi:hypothetical protein